MDPAGDAYPAAVELLSALREGGETLAVAESLTGGLLAATVTTVPGASTVFRGAVVAYATDLKVRLLGVPSDLVDRVGVVSAEVAEAMAAGARDRCAAAWALSTTGVAGPDEQEGKPVGTVYVGWAGPGGGGSDRLLLSGGRAEIRRDACRHALSLLRRMLSERADGEQPVPGAG